jgi:N,N-dimethylformamidase
MFLHDRCGSLPFTASGVCALRACLVFSFALLACVEQALAAKPPGQAERTLIGYAVPLTVRPGDTVDFKVSSFAGGYKADLVKIINGDSLSRYGDQFEVRSVKAPFSGKYKGDEQPLNPGSYVHVENTGMLDRLESFTVAGWIYPTFDPTEYEPPDLENPDPFFPPALNIASLILEEGQTIVSRYDASAKKGWALRLAPDFHLEFLVGDGRGKTRSVRSAEPVRDWDWAYAAVSYDADTGEATVHLHDKPFAPGDQFTARRLHASGEVGKVRHEGPLRIAAVLDGKGAANARFEKPGAVFNGRIQDVRTTNRALTADEIDQLAAEAVPDSLASAIVADWDFGRDMKTTKIRDVSGNGLDGVAVNIPDRAVRGRFWDGSTIRWTDAPDQYDAISFYADDLYDAEWSTDFSYQVPADLPGGIYAARLEQGDFADYVVFFVAAPKGKPKADLAIYLSDYNYLAYSNVTLGATAAKNYPGHNWNEMTSKFLKENLEYGTGGVYNYHVDGKNFSYGSRLRPDVGLKPGGITMYNFTQDTHITAFLEHENFSYDVITDELLDKEGLGLLNQYRVVISATHPEYVTTRIFDAIADYTAGGGRFIYMGGNGWFWSVGAHPELPGVMESRNFHDIGDRYLRNGNQGGLMHETGRTNGPVFGVEMGAMIWNGGSPFRRQPDADNPRAAWIFEGTKEGEVFGDYGVDRVNGGACEFEIDRYTPGNGVPRHALRLATSEPLRETIEDVQIIGYPLAIAYHPSKAPVWGRCDLVFFETPAGGAMLSFSSNGWISSTLENDFDNDVATITRNVVKRFLDPTPFPPVGAEDVADVDRAPEKPEYEGFDSK